MDSLFKKYRIGFLYFGSFAAITILMLMITFWTSYHFSVKAIVTTASDYQGKILMELNDRLQAQFKAVESVSLSISGNQDVMNLLGYQRDFYERHVLTERVSASFLSLAYSSSTIQSIHLYMHNPPGSSSGGTVEYFPLSEIREESWYADIENSNFVWIGEHDIQSHAGTTPVISFARKLTTVSGGFGGVVLINIKASTIQSMLGDSHLESQRLLLDLNGRKIVQVGNPLWKLDENEYKQLWEGHHSLSFHITKKMDKRPFPRFLINAAKIPGSNWVVAEITPWSMLTKDSRLMLKVLAFIGFFSIGAVLFICFYLNRKFTKPIYCLLHNMNEFPQRPQNQKLPMDYQNEFGQLFAGYDKLTNRIEELYRSLEEQYRRKKETEIKALQAMINPHFLYNTLDQLNWMAIKEGNDNMSRVLEMTGNMLRIGLSDGESLITVSQEFKFVESYLEIQRVRLGEDKINYQIEASDEMMQLYIPKMTLQPFIENSIKHGFHRRDKGNIHVRACVIDNDLLIYITDDGSGIHSKRTGKKTAGGYGIGNVLARLDAFFSGRYHLELVGLEQGGTQVVIRIPRLETNIQS